MKRTAFSSLLATALVVVMAIPALGWHDEVRTESDRYTVTEAKEFGPSGDPYYRYVMRAADVKVCRGFVRIPDERWVTSDTRLVIGNRMTLTVPGKWYRIKPGTYDAEWQWRFRDGKPTRTEYERVRVPGCYFTAVTPTVEFGISVVGKNGKRITRPFCIPADNEWKRTPWYFVKGNTIYSVRDRTNGKFLVKKKAAKPGWYGKLYQKFDRNATQYRGKC